LGIGRGGRADTDDVVVVEHHEDGDGSMKTNWKN
jgi:hypothetical protein